MQTLTGRPGWILLIGWGLCAIGILRANVFLEPLWTANGDDLGTQIKTTFLYAWPVYWLAIFFTLDPDFSWSAFVAMLPTLLILPAMIAGLFGWGDSRRINRVLIIFLLLGLLMLCVTGLGLEMDRQFSRLDGHILFTLLLLYLWWDWENKKRKPGPQPKICPPVPSLPTIGAIVIYHLGAAMLLLGTRSLADRFEISGGIILGLLLATAWSLSLARTLIRAKSSMDFLVILLPLVILFLIGPLTLLFGPVDYPVTLWQMEACTALGFTVLWLGLTSINQPLARSESLLILVLYMVYLAMRMLFLS